MFPCMRGNIRIAKQLMFFGFPIVLRKGTTHLDVARLSVRAPSHNKLIADSYDGIIHGLTSIIRRQLNHWFGLITSDGPYKNSFTALHLKWRTS